MRTLVIFSFGLLCALTLTLPLQAGRKANYVGKSTPDYQPTKYEVGWYDTKLDHFDFMENSTFKMKYLYSAEFFKNSSEKPGPIFVYVGNEGAVESYWNNSGYWTNVMAPKHGALLLFVEHRYFGESLPFGAKSLDGKNAKYLSSEQALADYGIFLHQYKKDHGLEKSPVIVFGGSYGGMLAAWFRMKYPQVVDGAIAASAPLVMYPGITSPYAFNEVVTNDFANAKPGCADYFRQGFQTLKELRTQSEHYAALKKELNWCSDIQSASDVDGIYGWISGAMGTMAMLDYPYPTDFMANVPGSPVTVGCEKLLDVVNSEEKVDNQVFESSENPFLQLLDRLLDDETPSSTLPDVKILKGMAAAVNVFYDYEGKTTCNGYGSETNDEIVLDSWGYMACTEQILPIASNGKTDFFWSQPWDLEAFSKQCEEQWGTPSRPSWVPEHFGGWNYEQDFVMYSNIVFSQGNLDPWHIGGVTKTITGGKDLISFVMEGAAHHLDLRYPNKADPVDVTKGREVEDQYVTKWIQEGLDRKLAQ